MGNIMRLGDAFDLLDKELGYEPCYFFRDIAVKRNDIRWNYDEKVMVKGDFAGSEYPYIRFEDGCKLMVLPF